MSMKNLISSGLVAGVLSGTVLALTVDGAVAAKKAPSAAASSESAARGKPAKGEAAPASTSTCNTYDGLRFCVRRGSINPERVYYIATVTVSISSERQDDASYRIFFPYAANGTDLDADGVSGWTVESLSGTKMCNTTNDQACVGIESLYTTIKSGSSLTFRLRKPQDPRTSAALADVQEGTLSSRFLIAGEGAAVRSQNFTIAGFPMKVQLAPPR